MIRYRVAAVAVMAGLAFAGLATPALAHNSLIGSNPAAKASVEVGPDVLELTFDQPIQAGQEINSIAVLSPGDDSQHWESGPVAVAGNKATAPLRPLGPAGEYQVGWRVLSADGHPVSGTFSFTLTKAGAGTPTPPEELAKFSNAGRQQAATEGDGIPVWVWIVGALVLIVVGVVVAMRIGGREESTD